MKSLGCGYIKEVYQEDIDDLKEVTIRLFQAYDLDGFNGRVQLIEYDEPYNETEWLKEMYIQFRESRPNLAAALMAEILGAKDGV